MLDEHQSHARSKIRSSALVLCVIHVLQELDVLEDLDVLEELEGLEELIPPLDLLLDD
jgi:hypothetical protein